MFSYLYYNSYVGAEVGVTVGSVLSSAVQLSRREQLELWGLLANLLAGVSPHQSHSIWLCSFCSGAQLRLCIIHVGTACCVVLRCRRSSLYAHAFDECHPVFGTPALKCSLPGAYSLATVQRTTRCLSSCWEWWRGQ